MPKEELAACNALHLLLFSGAVLCKMNDRNENNNELRKMEEGMD